MRAVGRQLRCAALTTCCNYENQGGTRRLWIELLPFVRLPSERVAHLFLRVRKPKSFTLCSTLTLHGNPKNFERLTKCNFWPSALHSFLPLQSAGFGSSRGTHKGTPAPPAPPTPLRVNLLPNAAPARKQLMPASVGVRRQPNSCVWATCCASSTDNYGNPKAEQPLGEFNNVQVDAISL